jgi:phytoene synthase
MDLEQTRYLDFPACSATATWWPAWSAKWRRASSARPDPQTTAYAHKLGLAFQLTNIIRDVGEDACAGASTCRSTSCSSSTSRRTRSCKRKHSDRFVALMKFQASARTALRRGAGAAAGRPARAEARPDDGQHLPHAAARDRGEDFQVLHQRISLTPVRKLWLAWKVQALGRM